MKPVNLHDVLDTVGRHLDLEWIWATHAEPDAAPSTSSGELDVMLPPAALDALYQCALTGDIAELRHHLDHLESRDQRYRPFVEHLRGLANTFRMRPIQEYLEQYRVQAPSQEMLKRLFEPARRGDVTRVREEAARLEASDAGCAPFARRLCNLAESYRIEDIQTMLASLIEEGNS